MGIQDGRIEHGSGCDDARDAALDDSFCKRGVFQLFGDGDLDPRFKEFRQVTVEGVIWNTAHRITGAFRQSDFEDGTRLVCILVKHFIKVTHAEQQNGTLRSLGFHLHILPHCGGKIGFLHDSPVRLIKQNTITCKKKASNQLETNFAEN